MAIERNVRGVCLVVATSESSFRKRVGKRALVIPEGLWASSDLQRRRSRRPAAPRSRHGQASRRRASRHQRSCTIVAAGTRSPRFVFGSAGLTSSLGAPPQLTAVRCHARCSWRGHNDFASKSSDDEGDGGDEACAVCGSAEVDPGCNDILLCDTGCTPMLLQPPSESSAPRCCRPAAIVAHACSTVARGTAPRAAGLQP